MDYIERKQMYEGKARYVERKNAENEEIGFPAQDDKKDLSKDSVLVSNIDLKSSGQDDEFQEEFLIELNHVCDFKKPSEDIADNFLVEIPLDKKKL